MVDFRTALEYVVDDDVTALVESRVHYGDSWRAEGGFSAWFNIKRKIDRLVRLLGREPETIQDKESPESGPFVRERYDIFAHIHADLARGGETVLDTVRDLRRYLTLVEAFLVEEGVDLPLSRDNILAGQRFSAAEERVAEMLNDVEEKMLVLSYQDAADQANALVQQASRTGYWKDLPEKLAALKAVQDRAVAAESYSPVEAAKAVVQKQRSERVGPFGFNFDEEMDFVPEVPAP